MAPKVNNTSSEHILQCADYLFWLSIDLRVDCSTKGHFRSHGLLKTKLELRSEPGVSIGHYCHWYFM